MDQQEAGLTRRRWAGPASETPPAAQPRCSRARSPPGCAAARSPARGAAPCPRPARAAARSPAPRGIARAGRAAARSRAPHPRRPGPGCAEARSPAAARYPAPRGRAWLCWRVGFPCRRFPLLWCFPPRCLGAAPLRFLCRALLLALMSLCLDVSGVPVPGRPPGHQHGSGWPAAAQQCSMQV